MVVAGRGKPLDQGKGKRGVMVMVRLWRHEQCVQASSGACKLAGGMLGMGMALQCMSGIHAVSTILAACVVLLFVQAIFR